MELDKSDFYNRNTEQLINGMVSFLDEPTELFKNEDFDELNNPLCVGIKNIIEMLPTPAISFMPLQNWSTSFLSHQDDSKAFSRNNKMKSNNYEKTCRNKDPYMQEVNRLMYCSTMGHPPWGSPEYFQAAENYALYGKDFLDFPTDSKFSRPMHLNYFDGDVSSQLQGPFPKSSPSQGFGLQTGKCANVGNTSVPQLPVMLNPSNYFTYPFYQTPNLVQPLMYSNPFLMTQYLNMFVRETQINTSIVQQHQLLSGCGSIHERLVYAQMLQQQIQTSQANFPSYSGHSGTTAGNKPKVKLQDVKKVNDLTQNSEESEFLKMNSNGINFYDNNLELDDVC